MTPTPSFAKLSNQEQAMLVVFGNNETIAVVSA